MAAIEMPPYLMTRSFDLTYVQQLSPTGEYGFIQTLDRTSPFWTASYDTGPLIPAYYQKWINFFDLLEGSRSTFLAYDPRRPMPFAYAGMVTTLDPWTQSGQAAPRVTAYDYTNSTITIDRLQNGAIINIGDYVACQIANIWYLWRSQTYNPSVAGNTATITVKPRPNMPTLPAASAIRYRMAPMEMKIVGKVTETDQGPSSLPSFQFNAGQYTARVPA